MAAMRQDLLELFDVSELKKYMTEEELAGLSGADAAEEKPSEASAPPSSAPRARRTARKAEE
jgi:hypothetical protein